METFFVRRIVQDGQPGRLLDAIFFPPPSPHHISFLIFKIDDTDKREDKDPKPQSPNSIRPTNRPTKGTAVSHLIALSQVCDEP